MMSEENKGSSQDKNNNKGSSAPTTPNKPVKPAPPPLRFVSESFQEQKEEQKKPK
ncbi:hypothetical protein ACXHVK_003235 [Morganella morganii]|nr:hypothetical protein [Morganella morganii]